MPSGGLVAMGNVRAFAADLRAGFLGLLGAQIAFLWGARRWYDAVVAVGDAYALGMANLTRLPTLYVGTAKSVYVAPYGRFERSLLRRARAVFVRDEPTAEALRGRRVQATAPGNVIVDLIDAAPAAFPGDWLGIVPGSRAQAYPDAVRLARIARELAERRPEIRTLLSIAPNLEASRFAAALGADGWSVTAGNDPAIAFEASHGPARLVGWHGSFGAFVRASIAVLGQAGTGNEQAAAFGRPVVAVATPPGSSDWYRMRQGRLLGAALLLVTPESAAREIEALLSDEPRLAAMAATGRERMGPPGGAAEIARAIVREVG